MKVYGIALLTAFAAAPSIAQAQPAERRAQDSSAAASARNGARIPDRGAAGRNLSSRDYFNLGVNYFLAGKIEQSVEAFSKAVELNPNYQDAYFNLGNSLRLLNRPHDAVKAYTQALSIDPKDATAYNRLGQVYYDLGSYRLAAENFTQAAKIFPSWADPQFRLSETYKKLGDARAAERYYEKATRLESSEKARKGAATAATPAPAGGAAVDAPRADAREAGPNPAPAAAREAKPVGGGAPGGAAKDQRREAKNYYKLGVKHGRAKQFDEAIKAFQQAIKYNPDYADAYYGLGRVYADAGRWGDAAEAYHQVLRIDPKDDEAASRLGEAYFKLRGEPRSHAPANVSTPTVERVGGVGAERAESNSRGSSNGTPPTARAASGPGAPAAPPAPGVTAGETPPSTSSAPAAELTRVYQVGPGDVLDVRLLNAPVNPSTPTLYVVTAGGLLDYPLAGDPMSVAGATVEEIGQRIAAGLKRLGFSKGQEVSVSVREYASHHVIVSGLVREPGTKIIQREAIPLYVILADAQLSPEAGQVQVSTPAGAKTTIDLNDSSALDIPIRSGDVITVQKRPVQFFYIGGKVDVPGEKAFHPGITLTQAILAAGGKLSRGGDVRLLRQSGQGYLSTSVFKLQDLTSGKVPDVPLQPNDRVEVIK
ncbi:MAG TPA: tetratricopeptide repeat protein [Pyrinomonadaceae bacterium]|jgi:tetratricopeptide (TPR) repeat protein/protein involved in polysaccharide export with SLBB domain|nr:tetratricopeptide repeat protein [Pyrinomonadaceae bacterium]